MPGFERVCFAALKDVGVKRSHNQDDFAAQPAADQAAWESHGDVFVVADGMGGHAVGEKASAKAVRDIPFIYVKHAKEGVAAAIRRAFVETNAGIYNVGQENPEFRGSGTTSTALFLRPEGAWVGHVGDSRAYRIRAGKAEQLTFDHSWVWEIARRQGVDPDHLGDFKKNVIIRSLGPDPEVEVDIEGPHPVEPGDAFLMCSDGLTGVVPPEDFGAVVSALPPDEAARFLIALANLRGGPDNITVLIIQTPGGTGQVPVPRPGPGLLRRTVAAWNRQVPWPFTALLAGGLLAILFILTWAAGVPGSEPLFILAALATLAGLIGIALEAWREQATPPEAEDGPRKLNVYKSHDCTVGRAVFDRFTQLEASLADAMRAQNVPADWDAHGGLAAVADTECKNGDLVAAFQARCRSLAFLADVFHRARNKAETFRPSWTSPTRM